MKPAYYPSGITRGLPLLVPEDWTPAQAAAVIELLDDLRELIYTRYLPSIQQQLQDDRRPQPFDPQQPDLPF